MKFRKISGTNKIPCKVGQFMRQQRREHDNKDVRVGIAEWAEGHGATQVYVQHTKMGGLYTIVLDIN